MQTFITDFDICKSAENLDVKRLGKQRVEAIQILDCLLVKESRWKNHPAVKMWKGYEKFLCDIYLYNHILAWFNLGFKSPLCFQKYLKYTAIVKNFKLKIPEWIKSNFIEAHRSNLIRKNHKFYRPKFQNTIEGLEYIWPVK